MDMNTPTRALQADQRIEVTLTAAQWNEVLRIMAEAPVPHRLTDPLLRNIQQQCMNATMEQV